MPDSESDDRSRQTTHDAVRQLLLGIVAVGLMAGGIVLALQSMGVDRELRLRYDDALALSQQALEVQNLAADLRAGQARRARALASVDAPPPAADAEPLEAGLAALGQKAEQLAQIGAASDQRADAERLTGALAMLGAVNTRLALAAERNGLSSQAATELTEQANRGVDEIEAALTRIVTASRDRTLAAARRAASLSELARVALIAFSGITLLLGVLLVVLATRTLRANRALMRQLELVAREDPLTGVTNRRGLDAGLPLELSRALRSGQPLAVVMIDLDHFKRFNDRRGHGAGDALLRQAAQAWAKLLRPTDMLARYGGEEFTLVLPGCPHEQAVQLVDRLRPGVPEHQTFSAGVALWDGAETATELLQRADQALLQAKKSGRNRTMIAGREPQATLPLKVA
jgi:diguanylate cyclase (GGDEF)-like protein